MLLTQKQFLCFISVNRCPSLSVPGNGTISTNIVLVGTVVEVKCLRGYMFPDRSTTAQIVCQSDRKWNATIQDCEGMIMICLVITL